MLCNPSGVMRAQEAPHACCHLDSIPIQLHIICMCQIHIPAPSQVVGASLWELLSPHARCLGRTSSRSQGFTGGFKSPCLRPDSLAMLGYFLHRQQAHFDAP